MATTPDYTTRIAALETYSKVQNEDIVELRREVREIREVVEDIRRDIHGARIGGRVGLAIAMALGGIVVWLAETLSVIDVGGK